MPPGTGSMIEEIETTLSWAEANLSAPRINCLEGWRVVYDYNGDLDTRVAERDTDENKQWMRLFTTLSLTHSDGYVLFGDGNALPTDDHLHNWYDFWDIRLGKPAGKLIVRTDGSFQREFKKATVIYNPQHNGPVKINFQTSHKRVSDGRVAREFELQEIDGDVFLKTK